MQRYFVDEPFNEQKQLTITGESARHISKVMRMQKGDKIIVVQKEIAYLCTILSVGQDVLVEQTGETIPSPEMPIQVDIACGLPKGDKLEFIAQKGTELGMHALIPFVAERSIVKWDEKRVIRKSNGYPKSLRKALNNPIEHLYRLFPLLFHLNNYWKHFLHMMQYLLLMKKRLRVSAQDLRIS